MSCRIYITVVFYFLLGGAVLAQKAGRPQKGLRPPAHEKGEALYLLADGRKDSVVLRWVPSSDVLWRLGNKYGYLVERFTVMRNGSLVPGGNRQARLLTPDPLRPWSKAAFDRLVEKEEYAGVLEEALYGDFNIKLQSESPSGILSQVQQSQNRFGFALLVCDYSPDVARAAALRLVDRKAVAGERYIYRVRIAMPDSLTRSLSYKPGVTMLGAGELFLRPSIRDLKAEFGNRAVALSWNQEMLHGVYTAYNIERSVEGGPFQKVNAQPYLQMTTSGGNDKYAYYVDSLPGNYVACAYRVTGLTPFGDAGAWSDTVRGEGVSKLDFRPVFDSVYLAPGGNSAVVRWSLPDSLRERVKGIYVSRAPRNQGPYTDINKDPFPPAQGQAIDPLVTGTSNYYKLRLVEKDGSQISSLPYFLPKEDSIPPAVPTGLDGVSDRKGIARIHWQPNVEKDLKGYRLFRSQVKNGEYVEITKGIFTDTAFTDTMNLAFTNSFVYYRLIAVDHYYNSSIYTAPLAVRRPDTIPPMPPVFTGVNRRDTVVYLSFIPSADKDVREYTLYCYDKEEKKRELVAVFPVRGREETTCTDDPAPVRLGKTLVYELEVSDSSGNRSVVRSGELFYETGFRGPVRALKAEADRDGRKIRLSWYCELRDIDKYIVYRAVNDKAGFQSYATLAGNKPEFEDRDLHVSNTYKYKIKAVLKNGIESLLSKEMAVSY